jgi:hypothetical protein
VRHTFRLAAILAMALALLVGLDRWAVPRLLDRDATLRALDATRTDTFRRVVYRNLEDANANVNASISRIHRRWRALPTRKEANELRVFLIGNSAALFSIVPEQLEERLARALPGRRVSVFPFLIPDIGIRDERVLVRAALAKRADVVVLTPNLKGMVAGDAERVRTVRDTFAPRRGGLPSPVDLLRRGLRRHWHTYAAREELRQIALRAIEDRLPWLVGRAGERAAIETAFAAIAAEAKRGDVGALIRTYHEHDLWRFVPDPIEARPLPRGSPLFRTIAETAARVRRGGARGIAIFLPVNPLYRDAAATAAHPEVRVDDTYVRALASHTLRVYRRAGFVTANRLDALAPEEFIDLVHPNAAGMRHFSEDATQIVVDALLLAPD